jgi:TPR repeat protein
MKRLMFSLLGCLVLRLGISAQSAGGASLPQRPDEQMLSEEKNFAECLSCVYSPAWWFSYHDSLYFQPRNQVQVQQLETLKAARSRYVALTNHETRHALTARIMAESGISDTWQAKILLPFSTTNQTLTPTLDRAVRVVPKYTVLQSLPSGDALIQEDASTYFVMNFGRGADDASRTNALLVREGVKSYSAGGGFRTFEAFANVALSKEETAVLNRVAAAFQKEAAALGQQISKLKYGQEFEEYKARANDTSPYLEYLLAKAYLEGRGTEKDERLGMEWMNRAAKSGSGDAASYLEALGRKAP